MPIEVDIKGEKQTVYTTEEHKQILQDAVGDLTGLKTTNASLKAEKQEAIDKLAVIEAEKKKAELDAAKAAGDFQKVQDLLSEEKERSDKALRDLQASLGKQEIDTLFSSTVTATGLGGVKNIHFEKILRADFDTEVVDGVLKIKSKADGSFIDKADFAKRITEMADYGDYVSGGNASGAGAPGANDSAGAVKNPFKKGENFNLTEQAKLLKENPELANRLRSQA